MESALEQGITVEMQERRMKRIGLGHIGDPQETFLARLDPGEAR